MNTVLKNAFQHLLTGDIASWEAHLCRQWGEHANPTDVDGRVTEKTGRHILENASSRPLNTAIKRLLKGNNIEDIDSDISSTLYYLRWVENGTLTDDGRRKAISFLPLKEQCERLGIPLQTLKIEPPIQDLERDVGYRLAPTNSALIFKPQRLLNILRLMVTSAAIEALEYSPIQHSLVKRMREGGGVHLDVYTLTQDRDNLRQSAPNLADRLQLEIENVWTLSEQIQSWRIHTLEDTASSFDSLMWHFDHNQFGLATELLGDESECRTELNVLWNAIGSAGVKRVVRALLNRRIREVGWPDLTFCLPGTLELCEVKKGPDRLSFSQIWEIEALRSEMCDVVPVIRVAYIS